MTGMETIRPDLLQIPPAQSQARLVWYAAVHGSLRVLGHVRPSEFRLVRGRAIIGSDFAPCLAQSGEPTQYLNR